MYKLDMLRKWATNSKEVTERILITLQLHYSVRHISNSDDHTAIVILPFCNVAARPDMPKWNSYEWFTLCGNGGEINVEPINHEERMRSIPYTDNRRTLTAETIAYRIWCAMTDQEIDYKYDAPAAHVDIEPLTISNYYF